MDLLRESFWEYYPPTEKEFLELWKNSTIVFDANILLNIYRYSPSTRDNLLGILEDVSDRIWVPYQAALEYQKNRLEVIQEKSEAYDKIIGTLRKNEDRISAELNSFKNHPYINIDGYLERIKANLDEIKKEIEDKKNEHPNLLASDEFREKITSLFENKVGEPYNEKRLAEIYIEGETRYKKGIPPGFKDISKEEAEKYGDLVLWYQIIDHAISTKKSIIFVTDDKKEDWWNKFKGKTISPHPYLIREMISKANVKFYMYQTEQFMNYAQKYIGSTVKEEAINEIKNIRTWNQMNEEIYNQYMNYINHSSDDEIQLLKEYLLKELTESKDNDKNYFYSLMCNRLYENYKKDSFIKDDVLKEIYLNETLKKILENLDLEDVSLNQINGLSPEKYNELKRILQLINVLRKKKLIGKKDDSEENDRNII